MLKRTFELTKEPGKVGEILLSLRKDRHLSKTFEGTPKNGLLDGYYTNLALINGMVISYVKIKGNYERKSGDLKLAVVPGNLYWAMMVFHILALSILAYKGIGSFLFLFMALAITVAFIIESRSFIKHMERIVNSNNQEQNTIKTT